MAEFKKGDKVEWNGPGKVQGTVVAKVEGEAHVKGHTAKASKDNPEYKVKSDKSGKEAIHKASALHKR